MIYNYHTHTKRCGHATDDAEEYILTAIAGGIKCMGFSEHFPYICENGFEASFRLPVSEIKEYFEELSFLREKYKDKIDIKIGFEMEYYPDKFEKMYNSAVEYGAEYLILGPHYITEESPDGIYVNKKTEDAEFLKAYASTVADGIRTKRFTYVAHPDVIKFTGDAEIYKKEMRKICVASKEAGIPLEINFLGIRDNRNYPSALFWGIAGKEQCPVTFGCDAHSEKTAFDKESFEKAKELVKKYNLNYIGKPELIKIG